jgi:hypothetical protein
MPYRRIFFEKNQPVHIVSRAVEGVRIFDQEDDCYRFIFHFYAINLGKRNSNLKGEEIIKAGQALLRGEEIPTKFIINRHPPLVYLLDFSLVINHYHFYLLPNVENSIPLLMQKLNNGFAKYFNLKHNRKDALFGSRYKSILVKTQFQSDAVSRYVSVINPLDVYETGWRERGLESWKEAFDFLKNYPFSSFPDKIGIRRAKILAPKEILEKYSFKNEDQEKYLEFVKTFLKEKKKFTPLFLE